MTYAAAGSASDRFVMGLLRASADVLLIGSWEDGDGSHRYVRAPRDRVALSGFDRVPTGVQRAQ